MLIENVHYVLLPEVIWKIFVTWYGNTGYSPLALPRTVSNKRPTVERDVIPSF